MYFSVFLPHIKDITVWNEWTVWPVPGGGPVWVFWTGMSCILSSWARGPLKQAFPRLVGFCIAVNDHWEAQSYFNILSSPEFNSNYQEWYKSSDQISFFVIFHWTRLTYAAYLYVLGVYRDGSVVKRRQQQVSYLLLYFLCVWQRHHDLNLENAPLSADRKKI